MPAYLGDFEQDATVYFCWNTNNKNGASITRATNGTIKVYKDDASESTAGIVDTEDFDGLTGIHNCKVNLAADAFYAPGHDYSVVLTGAVIDGETVNAALASFSIENRFAAGDLFQKAAKVLVNKAVQDKITGRICYYDDDGQTLLLTHTPTENESSIARNAN